MRWKADMLLADAQYVCRINYDLSQLSLNQFQLKKGLWENGSKVKNGKYYRAKQTIKVIVDAADLRFEVWYDGVRYGDKVVTVEWQ